MHGQHPVERFAVRGDRSGAAIALLVSGAVTALVLGWTGLALRGERTATLIGVQTATLVLSNALQAVAAVAVAAWTYRAYSNLFILKGRTLYSPLAAAAYFLIPGANLLVPHTVLRELWYGSDPSGVRTVARAPWRPLNVVTLWWYLFIASVVTSNVAAALMFRANATDRANDALIVSAICAAAAAAVGVDVIRLIDTRQALLRGAQPRTAGHVAVASPPAPAAATRTAPAPRAEVSSSWRSTLLPVVTAVERELEEVQQQEVAEPFEAFDIPKNLPSDLAPPSAAIVTVLFTIVAWLALLQGVFAIAFTLFPPNVPYPALMALTFPFGAIAFMVAIPAAIAFCSWLDRAYRHLRMYVEATPRPSVEVINDFVRGIGDASVLEELWAVTMSSRSDVSLARIDSWKTAWRTLQLSAVIAVVLMFFSPQPAMLAFGVMFLAGARAAALARAIARAVTAEQRDRFTLVKSRTAAPTRQQHGTGVPLPTPQ